MAARCQAGSPLIEITGRADFFPGQGVSLPQCGPAPSVPSPAAPTLRSLCRTLPCPHLAHWSYEIVAIDANHGLSRASPAAPSVLNANALSVEDHNLITWTPVPHAVAYAIYRSRDTGPFRLLTYSQISAFDDFGQPAVAAAGSIPPEAPARPILGNLVAIIASRTATQVRLNHPAIASCPHTWLVHDDAPILQRALDSLPTRTADNPGGGTLWLPPGSYTWASPVTITGASGVVLRGAGRWATQINPSVELAGMAAFRFIDSRDSGVEQMWINGAQVNGATPGTAVEFNENSRLGPSSTHNLARDLIIGNPSTGGSVVNGIVFSAINDANNENSDIENVVIEDFAGCGILIGHSNSEGHRFRHLDIGYGPCGIQAWSGGFTDEQGFYALNRYPQAVVYDFQPGTMYHSVQSIGMFAETGAQLLRASPQLRNLIVNIVAMDFTGGLPGEDLIDLASSDSALTITASWLQTGQPRTAIHSSGTGNTVRLMNNGGLGLSTIDAGNGAVASIGNNWYQVPRFVTGPDRLVQLGDWISPTQTLAGSLRPSLGAQH
ncbi:MAG TPA: glycosyl hydrolase family 28-related protein [Candidatus Binataceae bacterium]|nr:glycosyl hydrolase family 28-related protein [Candidatus Binataceae bacterium]